jgi:hypothetical protein
MTYLGNLRTRNVDDFLVVKAFPAAEYSVHFVSLPFADAEWPSVAMSAYHSLVANLTSFLLVLVGKVHGHCTVHHHGSTIKQILLSLKQHRFSKRTLPDCMGGNWSYETHQQFLQRQLHAEESRLLSVDEKLQRKRDNCIDHKHQPLQMLAFQHCQQRSQHLDLSNPLPEA